MARDESYIRNHIRPHYGHMAIGLIGQADVVSWVSSLEGKRLAPSTIQKIYQLFAATMQGAVDAEVIARTPCRHVTLPRLEPEEMRFSPRSDRGPG